MEGLKWPVDKCEKCGHDFTQREPRAYDKALSEDGSGALKWADFCPQCGKGYIVGDRVPFSQRSVSAKVITSQAEIIASAPDRRKAKAGLTDDLYDPDKPKGPQRTLKPSEFWCTKCALVHRESSKQGANHLKYKEA